MADAFARVVREAPAEDQLALIRAHPDLAGRAALAGELTPESAGEQASAGLDRLTPARPGPVHPAERRLSRALRLPVRHLRPGPERGGDPRGLRAPAAQRRRRPSARPPWTRSRRSCGCAWRRRRDPRPRGARRRLGRGRGGRGRGGGGPRARRRPSRDRRPGPPRHARRGGRPRAPERPRASRLGGLRHRHARPGRGRGDLRDRHAAQLGAADAGRGVLRRQGGRRPRKGPGGLRPLGRAGAGRRGTAWTRWPSAAWWASRPSCAPAAWRSSRRPTPRPSAAGWSGPRRWGCPWPCTPRTPRSWDPGPRGRGPQGAGACATGPPRGRSPPSCRPCGRPSRWPRDTGCALHVVHVSSPAAVDLIAAARREGLDVTCEACPHHLVLDDADAEALGAVAKCAPPLRSSPEREGLWERVVAGEVDLVASDHSPGPPEMKRGDDMFAVWGGISGAQTTLPLLLTHGAGARAPGGARRGPGDPRRRRRASGWPARAACGPAPTPTSRSCGPARPGSCGPRTWSTATATRPSSAGG